MNLLLDACVWRGSAEVLRAAGHDVICAGDWPEDPGDDQILAMASEQSRVLITLDKDFAELAIVHNRPHAGIVRLVGFRATSQGPVCCAVIERYGVELANGALLTVQPGRVRIRLSDSEGLR